MEQGPCDVEGIDDSIPSNVREIDDSDTDDREWFRQRHSLRPEQRAEDPSQIR